MFKLITTFLTFFSIQSLATTSENPVTDYVARLNHLEDFLIGISFISCILITIVFVYFAFRYRRTSETKEGQATARHNLFLEILWSFIPFVIFIVAFAWGWFLYNDFTVAPKNSLEIHVYGQKWNWDFIYKNGRKTSNELFVPSNRSVKLIITSRDVIHSFFIPAFRIKQDAVPGIYTSLWFKANREGIFQVFCTEFCGTGHSRMLAKLHVIPLNKWEEWLKNDPYKGLSMLDIGKKTFQGRCTACHRPTKEKLIGPGLAGLYKKTRFLQNGKSITADENYIRESILNPGAKIAKDFQNQMTPFAGLLSEEELAGLLEYIKSLK